MLHSTNIHIFSILKQGSLIARTGGLKKCLRQNAQHHRKSISSMDLFLSISQEGYH